MNILDGLLEMDKYQFHSHDVMMCFALMESTNKIFSLTKRGFMRDFCHLINKIHQKNSQAFDIVGKDIINGLVLQMFQELGSTSRFRYMSLLFVLGIVCVLTFRLSFVFYSEMMPTSIRDGLTNLAIGASLLNKFFFTFPMPPRGCYQSS